MSNSARLLPRPLRMASYRNAAPITTGVSSARDLVVDAIGILAAVSIGAISAWSRYQGLPHALVAADVAVGAAACLSLPARRRRPTTLAFVLASLSAISPASAGAAFAATLSVAVYRPMPVVAWIGGLGIATGLVNAALYSPPHVPYLANVTICVLVTVAAVGWGRAVRARRSLLTSLVERARLAEEKRHARIAEAKRIERIRLAGEMHDVLAHRMSLLSVHAGALEFRPDAPHDEIARAASVIRSGAHQMLVDLREVIGLLREDSAHDAGPPQPTLARLPELVEEVRQAGADVTLNLEITDADAVPPTVARTAYRIVQEGLTNARKHAPGMPVTVIVDGAPGNGLIVGVRQPLAERATDIPGGGVGLTGLAERATLAGGTLDHGPDNGMYVLHARLPWEA